MKADREVMDYINSAQPSFREVMHSIRSMIRELVPDAEEALKWGTPVYSRIRNICYMAAFKEHVTFAFYDGRMLKDPERILEGTGKMMRHVKIRKVEDIDREQVKKWIIEGFYY